jgi:hypothetical protein
METRPDDRFSHAASIARTYPRSSRLRGLIAATSPVGVWLYLPIAHGGAATLDRPQRGQTDVRPTPKLWGRSFAAPILAIGGFSSHEAKRGAEHLVDTRGSAVTRSRRLGRRRARGLKNDLSSIRVHETNFDRRSHLSWGKVRPRGGRNDKRTRLNRHHPTRPIRPRYGETGRLRRHRTARQYRLENAPAVVADAFRLEGLDGSLCRDLRMHGSRAEVQMHPRQLVRGDRTHRVGGGSRRNPLEDDWLFALGRPCGKNESSRYRRRGECSCSEVSPPPRYEQ